MQIFLQVCTANQKCEFIDIEQYPMFHPQLKNT